MDTLIIQGKHDTFSKCLAQLVSSPPRFNICYGSERVYGLLDRYEVAIANKRFDAVQELWRSTTEGEALDCYRSALHAAVRSGSLDSVKFVLKLRSNTISPATVLQNDFGYLYIIASRINIGDGAAVFHYLDELYPVLEQSFLAALQTYLLASACEGGNITVLRRLHRDGKPSLVAARKRNSIAKYRFGEAPTRAR